MKLALVVAAVSLAVSPPAHARDSLGVYAGWGAFRDRQVPRCYAIAMAEPGVRGEAQPYATVAHWPRRGVRNQVHLRLSRTLPPQARARLTVGEQSFVLTGGGSDAWAPDRRTDAAIVAAMRSGETMRVSARTAGGRGFSDSYELKGAATAMDAAALGCAAR